MGPRWTTEHIRNARGVRENARQYAGGGSTGSGSVTGHVAVFDGKQRLAFVSQHCTPPATEGQLFAQSASVVQDFGHSFFVGVGAVDAGGSFDSGGGSVGAMSPSGDEESAHALATRDARTAVTANADFEKVVYFTVRTLSPGAKKTRPNRLTTPFP